MGVFRGGVSWFGVVMHGCSFSHILDSMCAFSMFFYMYDFSNKKILKGITGVRRITFFLIWYEGQVSRSHRESNSRTI